MRDCFCTAVLPSSCTGIACQDPCCGVCLPEVVFVVFVFVQDSGPQICLRPITCICSLVSIPIARICNLQH